jgi:hypothetical protein
MIGRKSRISLPANREENLKTKNSSSNNNNNNNNNC